MGILEEFLKHKQMTEDMQNDFVNDTTMSVEEQEYLKKEIERQRNSDLDIERQYQKFHQIYVKKTENELQEANLIEDVDVRVVVRRAKCPQCGKELVSTTPVIFNAFTQEKIAKHDCECGYKCNLEYAYPRVAFVDKENNEIKAFSV